MNEADSFSVINKVVFSAEIFFAGRALVFFANSVMSFKVVCKVCNTSLYKDVTFSALS